MRASARATTKNKSISSIQAAEEAADAPKVVGRPRKRPPKVPEEFERSISDANTDSDAPAVKKSRRRRNSCSLALGSVAMRVFKGILKVQNPKPAKSKKVARRPKALYYTSQKVRLLNRCLYMYLKLPAQQKRVARSFIRNNCKKNNVNVERTSSSYLQTYLDAPPGSLQRRNVGKRLSERNVELSEITCGDLLGQVEYSILIRPYFSVDLASLVRRYLTIQEYASAVGLCVVDACMLKAKKGLGDDSYKLLRSLSPEGMFPSLTAVSESKMVKKGNTRRVEGVEDAAYSDVLPMLLADLKL